MKILIVEDEKEISDFLKSSLEAEFFTVDTSANGEEGLSLAKHNEYDLVILDYILPKMNGKEICKAIRKSKNSVPIIMLSVKSDAPTKTELLELGADDYVAKPFSFEELRARIKAILRRPKQIQNKILKARNITLNPEKREAKKANKEIKLTKKEFMLLEFLMLNKGRIVSRGSLMEHVWDINADPFSNTIEAHMQSLRKKLGSGKNKSIIKTIFGSGYTISD